jgi:hypothetical protein
MSGRRTWIRLWVSDWLRGDIRQESAAVRGILADLICLAGDSAFGNEGLIMLSKGVGYTTEQLQQVLNVNKEELEHAFEVLKKTGEIIIREHGEIEMIKWDRYQSEYQRQRQYREKAPTKKLYSMWLKAWGERHQEEYKYKGRDFTALKRIFHITKCTPEEFLVRAREAISRGIREIGGLEQFWNKFAPKKKDEFEEA